MGEPNETKLNEKLATLCYQQQTTLSILVKKVYDNKECAAIHGERVINLWVYMTYSSVLTCFKQRRVFAVWIITGLSL